MARAIDADDLQRKICGAKCGCEYEDCANEHDCEFDFFIFHAPTIEPKQEWISVKDRLPERKREYLCVCQFGDDSNWRYYNVLLFHPEKNADNGCVKGPHFSNEGMYDMRVTHWMELPELPERDGE